MSNIFIGDSQSFLKEQRSKTSTEMNERVRPISKLKQLEESLLRFILLDKIISVLTLIGVVVVAIKYLYTMKIVRECIDCGEKNDGISMFSKEQVLLAALVTALVLLNCICTLIVLNQFWNSVLKKELGFLHCQRNLGLVVLLVQIALVLACYVNFDYDTKIIMVSMIPLCYRYIFLMKLVKYISEIKIVNNRYHHPRPTYSRITNEELRSAFLSRDELNEIRC